MAIRRHLLHKWRRPINGESSTPFPAKLLPFDTKDQVFFQMVEKAREKGLPPPRRISGYDASNPPRIEWDEDGWHHTWEYAGVHVA